MRYMWNTLTKRQYENEVSWSTSTWLALQAQRLSVAVHIASAWEIATEMQLAGGGGEAPSSDDLRRAPPRRESPHPTLSGVAPRCVFLFVCVCVCLSYTCSFNVKSILSSKVGACIGQV